MSGIPYNIVEIFETEDYLSCNSFLEKGWILILVCQKVEEISDNCFENYPLYILGRPKNIPKD